MARRPSHVEKETSHDVSDNISEKLWSEAFIKFSDRSPELADAYRAFLDKMLQDTEAVDATDLPKAADALVTMLCKRRLDSPWTIPLSSERPTNVRKLIDKLTKLLGALDGIVKSVVDNQPNAALAWSSISILVTVCTNDKLLQPHSRTTRLSC